MFFLLADMQISSRTKQNSCWCFFWLSPPYPCSSSVYRVYAFYRRPSQFSTAPSSSVALFATERYLFFFELAVERAYPVGEGIAGGILQTVANLITLLFYVAFMVPHSDVLWMNWVAVGGLGICTLGLIIYREKFTRLNLDICINSNTDRASNA